MTAFHLPQSKLRRLRRCAMFSAGVVAAGTVFFWGLKYCAIALSALPGANAIIPPLLLFLSITILTYANHHHHT